MWSRKMVRPRIGPMGRSRNSTVVSSWRVVSDEGPVRDPVAPQPGAEIGQRDRLQALPWILVAPRRIDVEAARLRRRQRGRAGVLRVLEVQAAAVDAHTDDGVGARLVETPVRDHHDLLFCQRKIVHEVVTRCPLGERRVEQPAHKAPYLVEIKAALYQ